MAQGDEAGRRELDGTNNSPLPLSPGERSTKIGSGRQSVASVNEDERSGSSRNSGVKVEEDGPASLRKRRHRSHSSPELHSQAAYQADYPFPPAESPSSYARDLAGSYQTGHNGSPSSSAPLLQGGSRMAGEDTITLRRREANRLAAQRFRSRKKGYQDSLEERIRQLEDERDGLLRRLGEHPDGGQRGEDDPYSRYPSYAPPNRRQFGGAAGPSVSPERREIIDADVRVASLEAANRRLQDELRAVIEENEKMQEELEHWRRWERESLPATSASRRSEDDRPVSSRRRPSLPPLESAPYTSSNYSSHPYLPVPIGPSNPPTHPPLERARTYHNAPPRVGSPGIRLPPLRLPPLPANISDARTLPSPSMMAYGGNDPFRPPRDGAPSPRISQSATQTPAEESRARLPD